MHTEPRPNRRFRRLLPVVAVSASLLAAGPLPVAHAHAGPPARVAKPPRRSVAVTPTRPRSVTPGPARTEGA